MTRQELVDRITQLYSIDAAHGLSDEELEEINVLEQMLLKYEVEDISLTQIILAKKYKSLDEARIDYMYIAQCDAQINAGYILESYRERLIKSN